MKAMLIPPQSAIPTPAVEAGSGSPAFRTPGSSETRHTFSSALHSARQNEGREPTPNSSESKAQDNDPGAPDRTRSRPAERQSKPTGEPAAPSSEAASNRHEGTTCRCPDGEDRAQPHTSNASDIPPHVLTVALWQPSTTNVSPSQPVILSVRESGTGASPSSPMAAAMQDNAQTTVDSSTPKSSTDSQGGEQAKGEPSHPTLWHNPTTVGIAIKPLPENLPIANAPVENGAVIAVAVRTPESVPPTRDLPAAEPNHGGGNLPLAMLARDTAPDRLATFPRQSSPAQPEIAGQEAPTLAAMTLFGDEVPAHRSDATAPVSHAQNPDVFPTNDQASPQSRTIIPQPDWQSFSAFEGRPDSEGTDRDNSHEDRATDPFPQDVSALPGSAHGTGAPATVSAVGGELGHLMARAPENQTPQPPVAAPPVAGVQRTDEEPPPPSRSVTFEVMQPDLGRVNIRVAVTHDLVHAYFASDRPEVGQFLLNGQDRLQSALQNSGLDLGQFRVDIERQSAGRSFQQGHQQGQHEPSGQNAARPLHDQPRIVHEHRVLQYRGSLNLVA